MITIATIVGARPQFIKSAAISRAIAKHNKYKTNGFSPINEIIFHTGQHYNYEMSAIFFKELGLPDPAYHLSVDSGNHGFQTGKVMEKLEGPLMKIKPDLVLVYGDTNSTLAGVLTAAKLNIPVAHVEAGLSSYPRNGQNPTVPSRRTTQPQLEAQISDYDVSVCAVLCCEDGKVQDPVVAASS